MRRSLHVVFIPLLYAIAPAASAGSTCYGTPSNGRIEAAVALPAVGPNFAAYANLGVQLGRTYLHSTVAQVVIDAYRALKGTDPAARFVYGETGLRHGGPMPPHRTHQSGSSVDFMVPVRDADGRVAILPSTPANRFGYDVEFDADGRSGTLRIDFDALAAHLMHLDDQARRHGAAIARVIFDPVLTRKLLGRPQGAALKTLPFMKSKPWIRHDEHYHVDFALPCLPMKEAAG